MEWTPIKQHRLAVPQIERAGSDPCIEYLAGDTGTEVVEQRCGETSVQPTWRTSMLRLWGEDGRAHAIDHIDGWVQPQDNSFEFDSDSGFDGFVDAVLSR